MSSNGLQSNGNTTSSIKIDHRVHRTVPDAAVQALIKPFGAMILKPPHPLPAGSPQLTPPGSAQKHCDIEEKKIADTYIYTFTKKGEEQRVSRPTNWLYYMAGGGFRGTASREHWLMCAELCTQLPEYEINLISYPLVPNSPAPDSIPHLQALYRELAVQSRTEHSRLTFMGDSAGGNIALILGLYGASLFLEEESVEEGICPIQSIFAICPPTDLRNEHPDIDAIDPKDPILSRKVIDEVAEGWRGEWPASDPRLSPILADLSVLQRANVKVDGVTAGHDVLSPDTIVFRERLAEIEVSGHWLHWEKQMHCFPLMFPYHIPESVKCKDWIVDVLRTNIQASG